MEKYYAIKYSHRWLARVREDIDMTMSVALCIRGCYLISIHSISISFHSSFGFKELCGPAWRYLLGLTSWLFGSDQVLGTRSLPGLQIEIQRIQLLSNELLRLPNLQPFTEPQAIHIPFCCMNTMNNITGARHDIQDFIFSYTTSANVRRGVATPHSGFRKNSIWLKVSENYTHEFPAAVWLQSKGLHPIAQLLVTQRLWLKLWSRRRVTLRW